MRLKIESPKWRTFQLAFLLLNLPGLANPSDPDRETVDLLFFPTGGGKTEAYLGLAAFAMVLRRRHHPGDKGLAGAGVSVIMRYTLRLLTLDQLGRAAGLVCALELERENDPAQYGPWPFEIGLWVGYVFTGYPIELELAQVAVAALSIVPRRFAIAVEAQPVGTTPDDPLRGSKLGGAVLAMKACTALYMKSHRSTPWRRQVS